MVLLKKYSLILLIQLLIISCERNKSIEIVNEKVVAQIDDAVILQEEIDSLISRELFELRREALNDLIFNKLLIQESVNKNLSVNELIMIEIVNKTRIIQKEDIFNYINSTGRNETDTITAKNHLIKYYQEERKKILFDSLAEIYCIKRKLIPPTFKKINTSNLYSYSDSSVESNFEVIIITDYNCYSCVKKNIFIEDIIKRYNNYINFKFLLFSSYYDNGAFALEAANNQGAVTRMLRLFFHNHFLLDNDSIYFHFAKELELNLNDFRNDMNQPHGIINILKTRDFLINEGVYSTPVFIVNGKVLDDMYAIDYLEEFIINEFNLNE